MTSTDKRRERYTLPGNGPTDEDLEREVELTRAELGDTVAELAHRLDVKNRVREATRRDAERVRVFVQQHRSALAAGGGVVLAAVIAVLLYRR
jgi:hypothetical protein